GCKSAINELEKVDLGVSASGPIWTRWIRIDHADVDYASSPATPEDRVLSEVRRRGTRSVDLLVL
ncbi:hypothetical protein PIB30_097503, partial [Stylosanthes scabra]|nr:hypothetical protein [Stylosanthes scabra]